MVGWRVSCSLGQLVVVVVWGLLFEAADLAVAQPAVAEGEDLAGDGDLGDLAAAAFGDPLVLGPQRPAAGGGVLRGLGQRPAQRGRALVGDVAHIAVNSKARHDYVIRETYEAGLVLTGTEIKSIRAGKVNMREAFARVENGEVWLYNLHIAQYDWGNRWNHAPTRPRKLLLHKSQIRELQQQTRGKGLTMVPVRLYISRDHAKIELAIAQGKKIYDKRATMAEREAERDIERAVRARY